MDDEPADITFNQQEVTWCDVSEKFHWVTSHHITSTLLGTLRAQCILLCCVVLGDHKDPAAEVEVADGEVTREEEDGEDPVEAAEEAVVDVVATKMQLLMLSTFLLV